MRRCAALESADSSAGFSKNVPSSIALFTRIEVLVEHAPGADRQVPDLGVPICPGGRPTASPEASSLAADTCARAGRSSAFLPASTAFPGPGGAQPQPSRMTSATSGSCSANRRERFELERRAADERTVDVRLREQLGRVVGLHRAAVEDGHVEQRLDERVRLLRELGRRGLAGADRPHRLVGDARAARRPRARRPAGAGRPRSRRARAPPRSRRRRRSRQPRLERGAARAARRVSSVSPK